MQEITPQLEKLSKDKETFMKFRNNESEIALLQKQIAAYDYHRTLRAKEAKREEVDLLRKEGEQLVNVID